MRKNYLKRLRTLVGSRKLIHPAARIIVENEKGEVLFIRRKDNGNWGIPAGALEEEETIGECIKREVKEETGIELRSLILIGLSTDPEKESVVYPNGDQVQYFTAEFFSNDWEGDLCPGDEEVIEVTFKDKTWQEKLPENEQSVFHSLAYFRRTGTVRLT